jgi:hypothetical protein
MPKNKLAKASEILPEIVKPETKAQKKLSAAALEIHANPDAVGHAFMARQLVLCTLPHSDPGDVPVCVADREHRRL